MGLASEREKCRESLLSWGQRSKGSKMRELPVRKGQQPRAEAGESAGAMGGVLSWEGAPSDCHVRVP